MLTPKGAVFFRFFDTHNLYWLGCARNELFELLYNKNAFDTRDRMVTSRKEAVFFRPFVRSLVCLSLVFVCALCKSNGCRVAELGGMRLNSPSL